MSFGKSLIVAASLGLAASVLAPSARAGVVVGISLPVPVVAPVVAVAPVVQTVPAPVVYVNPVFGFYGAPCCFYGGYRHFYSGYRGGYGYRGIVRGGEVHVAGRRR